MWFKNRRARRIAAVRRQLAGPVTSQPPELHTAAPTRSDYVFALLLRGEFSRKTHK